MCDTCNRAARGGDTILHGAGNVTVSGSGTATDPYILTVGQSSDNLLFTVRDSDTVNLQLTGSGSTGDPFVLRADTSSASNLRSLGDVASTPAFTQGGVPMWLGNTVGGHFEARTPGTRYTTSTTRGNGLYQGEVVRDTDTQKRYEWDGSQWLSLDVTIPSFALDPSVLQNGGSVTASTDWNTLITQARVYRVAAGITSSNNGPQGAYGYGTLEVLISGDSVTQNYYTDQTRQMWTRTKWQPSASLFAPWTRVSTQLDTDPKEAQYPAFPGTVTVFDPTTSSTWISRQGSLVNLIVNISVPGGANTSNTSLLLSTANNSWAVPYKNTRGSLLVFAPGTGWNDPTYQRVDVEWRTDGGLYVVRGAAPAGSGLFGELTTRGV